MGEMSDREVREIMDAETSTVSDTIETTGQDVPEAHPGRCARGKFIQGNTEARATMNQPDKVPTFRELVRTAIDDQGGLDFVKQQAAKHPIEVLKLAARMEPKQVQVSNVTTHVVMVMLPVPPPEGWVPPIDVVPSGCLPAPEEGD